MTRILRTPHGSRRAVNAATVLTLCVGLRSAATCQQTSLQLRVSEAGRELVRLNESGGDSDTLFSSRDGVLWQPAVSPDEKMVALVQLGTERKGALVVLNRDGRIVASYGRDIQQFDWCSDANAIIFVTGRPREGGEPPFFPTGVHVLELSSGSTRRLTAPEGAYAVECAAFDHAAYVKVGLRRPGEAVFRIELFSGRSTPTGLYDFHFSPSGRYYLYYNKLIDSIPVGWHVIERPGNNSVPVPAALGMIEGWALGQGHTLSLVRSADPGRAATGVRVRPAVRRARVVRTLYDVEKSMIVSQVTGEAVAGLVEAEGARSLIVAGQLRAVRPTSER